MAALQKEMDRENPRKDIILPLLKETFPSRRQHILGDSDDLSVTTILETYKPLSLPFAVSSMFPRYQYFPHNLAIRCGQYVLYFLKTTNMGQGLQRDRLKAWKCNFLLRNPNPPTVYVAVLVRN